MWLVMPTRRQVYLRMSQNSNLSLLTMLYNARLTLSDMVRQQGQQL